MAHFEVVVCIAWAKMWIHAHFWLGLPVKRSKTSSVCCVDGPAACPGSLSWLYVAMSGGLHEYHWYHWQSHPLQDSDRPGGRGGVASFLFREVASVVHWGRCGAGCVSF